MFKKKIVFLCLIIASIVTLIACNNTQITAKDKKLVLMNEIEFIMPADWEEKVEIKEEQKRIDFVYTKIPNRKIDLLSINIWTRDEYERIRKQEGASFNEELVIGENNTHVFYLITPIDSDLTLEEDEKYGEDIRSVNSPISETIKRFSVIK